MSTQELPPLDAQDSRPKVRISGGTAIKIGFLGAFGAFLFTLIVWLVLAVIAMIIGPSLVDTFQQLIWGR